MLKPLHDPKTGPMRVVGLISGSGTNLRRILEHERALAARDEKLFEVVAIFSDSHTSNAPEIGRDFDVPVVIHDIRAFYARRKTPRRDMALRAEFDAETVRLLAPFGANVAAYAGYMSIVTEPIINAFVGVNVHPADLSVERAGKRVFTGDHAVRDAAAAGEQTIRSSTHLIEPVVDGGRLLMISAPVKVEIPQGLSLERGEDLAEIEEHNQERLKVDGDWVVFPRTLEEMARGSFARDESGAIHYKGQPIPKGLRL